MDDLMSKIQDVLSDEESMNQIKKLAGMLGGENSEGTADFSSIFGGNKASSESDGSTESNGEFDFDFSKLIKLQEILSQANKKDHNTEFLYALKPILKDENQIKIDRIIKILKLLAMWPLIKDSGILGGDLFDFL